MGRKIGKDFNILLIALMAKNFYGESLIVCKAAPSTGLELFSARFSPSLFNPFSVHWNSAQTFDVSLSLASGMKSSKHANFKFSLRRVSETEWKIRCRTLIERMGSLGDSGLRNWCQAQLFVRARSHVVTIISESISSYMKRNVRHTFLVVCEIKNWMERVFFCKK